MEPHAVGARQQGELLVDDRLDGRYVVAAGAHRVDLRLERLIGRVEFVEPLFEPPDAAAQVLPELPGGLAYEFFVAGVPLAADFALRFVGLRLEHDAEDVAVALFEVVQNQRE